MKHSYTNMRVYARCRKPAFFKFYGAKESAGDFVTTQIWVHQPGMGPEILHF